MGACSSKPKTTEFEGSTEPSKETGVATADRSLESVDAPQISQSNEPGKQEVGAADVNTEASQQTSQPFSSKDEEPVVKGLSSTEEGVPRSVKAETDAVDKEAHSGTAESGNVDDGIVQKVDEGVGAAATEEASDKATTADGGACVDQDKDFEDKAVVLDEAGTGPGDTYVDKGVAADEEKGQDSGTAATQDEQSKNLQDIPEPPGGESPIIGVVQPADPVHVDDVSESVGLATLEAPAPVDSTGSKSPVEIERDISTGTNTGEHSSAPTEAAYVSPDLPQETSDESREAPHDDPKVSPLVASVSDDGVVQENGADDIRGKEELSASAYAQDVKDKIEPEKVEDAQGDIDERTIEPQEENSLKEVEKDLHAEVPENEGNAEIVDERQPEALNVIEAKDAETSSEHNTGTTLEKAVEEQDDHIVEEQPVVNDRHPQTLAIEEPAEGSKPEDSPDEGVARPSAETEPEEKVEKPHSEEVGTIEGKGERVNAGKRELPVEKERNGLGEGDPAFEDASDVLLKVDPSTIELGDRRSP